MNLKSSFYFCILFLLKASIALSAPHSSYPDEDEEALIDKLASLAAAVGPDSNFDLASSYLAAAGVRPGPVVGPGGPSLIGGDFGGIGGIGGGSEQNLVAPEAILKLPREFGYKPNDIRFYLPADQFPPQQAPHPQRNDREESAEELFGGDQPPPPPPQKQAPPPPPQYERLPSLQQQGQHEFVLGDDKSDFYFMKKKEQMGGERGARQGGGAIQGGGDFASSPIRSYVPVPGPSHIMASDHSANYPGFTSSQMTDKPFSYSDMYYIAIVAGCSAAAVVGLIAAGICWYRIHERIKAAADVDYPAYGVTGPSKDITPSGGGDRKLAQSAQMYHYQHQKQQMAALQKGAIPGGDRQGSGGSDVESDDDNEDGDYTVYECPGLAPAGEMEVNNPLFNDEQPTPATPSNGATKQQQEQQNPPQQATPQQQQASSQDSGSSSAAESASSSSASSTATVTSSTPKVTESPKTPPPQQTQQEQPASGGGKHGESKGKAGKGDKK